MINLDDHKVYGEARNILVKAIQLIKPETTQNQAENMIINAGNYIQLERLKKAEDNE